MNRIYTIFIVVLTTHFALEAQTTRNILFEEFTSASSNASALLNPTFDSLLMLNDTNCILLKYPLGFSTGDDPFYDQSNVATDARAAYYGGISGLPQVFVDGNALAGVSPGVINQNTINTRAADSAYIQIELDHTISSNLNTVTVNCKIKNRYTTPIFTGRVLQIALVEEQINTPFVLGSNGEKVFNGIVRTMIPSTNGTTLPLIAVGDSFSVSLQANIPNYIYNLEELAVVAFVQNNNTKEVFQSAISNPKPLPVGANVVDISARAITVLPNDWCSDVITPTVVVTNERTDTVYSVQASYSINGVTWQSLTSNTTLEQGEQDTLFFASTTLSSGHNTLMYRIDTINSGQTDVNLSNQIIKNDSIFTFTTLAGDTSLQENFEGYTLGTVETNKSYLDNPKQHYVAIVDSSISSTVTNQLGSYGNSTSSYMWDFWNMPKGEHATLIFDKIDFSNRTSSILNFAYAHANIASEKDSLLVLASTDCGLTWNVLETLTDTSLHTATNHAASTFYPEETEWKHTAIDLNSYNGTNEILIAFRGISDYGNNLFIDDITLNNQAINVPINEIEIYNPLLVKLYPNPTHESLNIELGEDLVYTGGTILVTNSLGQHIYKNTLNSSRVNLDCSTYPKGTYFITIKQQQHLQTIPFIKN